MTERERALDEFHRLAEIWGGRIERWPEARRAWAEALSSDPRAAEILAAERRLDARLDAQPAVSEQRAAAIAGAVMGRIAAEAAQPGPSWLAWVEGAFFAPNGAPAFAAYALLVVGVAAGAVMGLAAPIGAGPEQEIAVLLGDSALPFGTAIR